MSEAIGEAIAGALPDQRVTELEIEVARLAAELDEARGGDAVAATSRFLQLAASTIDRAVADMSNEAESAVVEARGEIQRLRAEAERSAAEARAEAERAAAAAMAEAEAARAAAAQVTVGARRELEQARTTAMTLAEEAAAVAEETQRHARNEADQIIAKARDEASTAVVYERQRLAREVDALTGVREALIKERQALEEYHTQLQTRVRELAQAMVSFMSAGSSGGGLDALANLTTPEIGSSPVDHGLPPVSTVPEPAAVLEDLPPLAPPPEPVAEQVAAQDVTDEGYPVAAIEAYAASFAASTRYDPSPVESEDHTGDAAAQVEDLATADRRPIVEPIGPQAEGPDPTMVEENPWRETDSSAPLPGLLFGGPIEPSVLLAARDDDDLFGPARPGEGISTEPGSLARLFTESDAPAGYGANDDEEAAEADAQFKDFIEGDIDDDASRAWFLRSDDT
jgi:hypothetical protein